MERQGKELDVARFVGPLGLLFLVVLVLPLCTFSGAANESTAMEVREPVALRSGDFFDYELDISNLARSIVEEEGTGTGTVKDVNTKYTETVTGIENMTIGDAKVEAYIIEMEMRMGFTIVDEPNQIMTKMDIIATGKEWINGRTLGTVKEERTERSLMTATYGEGAFSSTTVIETETTTMNEYSQIDATDPFPLEQGRKWTTNDSYGSSISERSRFKFGSEPFSDWETNSTTEQIAAKTYHTTLVPTNVTAPAGKFPALGLKNQVEGSPEQETVYLNRFGMVVQREIYEDGNLTLVMKIKEWRFQNAKDIDNDGTIDMKDAFPTDKAASLDSDHDGYPDSWNEGMTEKDSPSGLELDRYPLDPARWTDGRDSSSPAMILVFIAVIGLMLVLTAIAAVRKFFTGK